MLTNGQSDPSFAYFTGGGKLTAWNEYFYVAVGQEVRRLLPTGQPDASFIGLSTGPYFNSLQGGDYHVFPDGRVLMSGAHILSDTARGFTGIHHLIWFSNQGYLDTTRVHRKGNGPIWWFKELPDGKFICSCSCTLYEGQPVSRLFRVHADGSLDTAFNPGVSTGSIFHYHALPDGRVYAAGRFTRSEQPGQTLWLARFMPDGSLDPAFEPPQLAPSDPPANFGIAATHILPWLEGDLIVTGQFGSVNGQPRSGIFMVDDSGSLKSTFDGCGVGQFQYSNYIYRTIDFITQDSTGHLYICGAYTGYTDGTTNDPLQRFVTRLHVGDLTTGASTSTATPAFALYPNPSTGTVTLQLEQVPHNAQVLVRDALGREVLRQRVGGHYTILSVERSGVYIMELWSGGQRVSAQRLVVE